MNVEQLSSMLEWLDLMVKKSVSGVTVKYQPSNGETNSGGFYVVSFHNVGKVFPTAQEALIDAMNRYYGEE